MQTRFSPAQLDDPATARSEGAIRKCVHCGFCTATCPTYVLLGDENDSPRGRIYLIKEMLENARPPTTQDVRHIDRCLSCLACETTCPSGVDYRLLIDHARAYVEKNHKRPLLDRLHRDFLAWLMPKPALFHLALLAAAIGRPLAPLLPKRLRVMLDLAPKRKAAAPPSVDEPAPRESLNLRVALLPGCVQQVLAPEINAVAARVLRRMGVEVSSAPAPTCCGSLTHHMGKEDAAKAAARLAIDAWIAEMDGPGLDAVVITTSGCGVTIMDYPVMFAEEPEYAEKAKRVAAKAGDISVFMANVGVNLPINREIAEAGLRVAYHSACSLQHGQKVTDVPKILLEGCGFTLTPVAEGHLCCGSAGTYNILQPDIAAQLKERKVANLERGRPDVIATGNIGCMMQIASGTDVPVVHTIELLDWATGGPKPAALAGR
jgi:glycolate oxidase iron-sulfur subunit